MPRYNRVDFKSSYKLQDFIVASYFYSPDAPNFFYSLTYLSHLSLMHPSIRLGLILSLHPAGTPILRGLWLYHQITNYCGTFWVKEVLETARYKIEAQPEEEETGCEYASYLLLRTEWGGQVGKRNVEVGAVAEEVTHAKGTAEDHSRSTHSSELPCLCETPGAHSTGGNAIHAFTNVATLLCAVTSIL